MGIFLVGYMGCGKSSVGRELAQSVNFDFIDFDEYIEEIEGTSISQIFEDKGEIYFRKLEANSLIELASNQLDRTVISLGGGTPCYGTNLDIIKRSGLISLYLNTSVQELTKRLWLEKEIRPLIKDQNSLEELEEFIRKHLFERAYYYNQATKSIKTDSKTIQAIVEEIVVNLF